MSKLIYLYVFLLISKISFSQKINLIIKINEKLLNEEVTNIGIELESGKKFVVNYYPGDLILGDEVWKIIQNENIDKFSLYFEYNTYKKGKQETANFNINLNKFLLKQPYIIVDIFDFRDKKYKHWYQWITKENYLVQLTYPGSGLYIRRR